MATRSWSSASQMRSAPRRRQAYAAASLVNLERFEEALEAFEGAPRGEDGLLDFYRALACYGAHLYACADEVLGTTGDRGGPRDRRRGRGAPPEHRGRRGSAAADDVFGYAARCGFSYGSASVSGAYCPGSADLDARRAELSRTSARGGSPTAPTRGARP